jgi:hypothetical protein
MATLSKATLTATMSTEQAGKWTVTASYDVKFNPAEIPNGEFQDWVVFDGVGLDFAELTPTSAAVSRHKRFTGMEVPFGGPVNLKATIHLKNQGLNLPSQSIDTPTLTFGSNVGGILVSGPTS